MDDNTSRARGRYGEWIAVRRRSRYLNTVVQRVGVALYVQRFNGFHERFWLVRFLSSASMAHTICVFFKLYFCLPLRRLSQAVALVEMGSLHGHLDWARMLWTVMLQPPV